MNDKFYLRLKSLLLLPVLFLLLITMSMGARAQTVTISTDQDDYFPGEIVVITGSGWIPGDKCQLSITHIGDYIPDHTHTPWTLIVDENGNLYDEWPVGDMELNTTLWLQAQSLSVTTMYAERIFTDAAPNKVASITVTSPSTVTGDYGTIFSVIYSVTVTPDGGTGNQASDVDLSVSGLPNGATAVFTPSSITLPKGSTTPITVSLRITSSAATPAGTSTITVKADNKNTDVSFIVSQKTIAIVAAVANNKIYDGTNAAIITGTLTGIVGNDVVTLNGTGTFSQVMPGTGLAVTSNCTLSGAQAGNYRLIQPLELSANISTKALAITRLTADNKEYDGNTTAILNTTNAVLSGVVSGDAVSLNKVNATGTFADKNVGGGKTVTTSGFTISGSNAGNYTLAQPTITANITAKSLTITGVTANEKVYDGTTTGTLDKESAVLSAIVSGDDVTLNISNAVGTFASTDAGSNIAVTASGFSISGEDAGNYNLIQPTGLTANITRNPLTISGVIAIGKVYDGTATAILDIADIALEGIIQGDNVNLNSIGASASFADKNVGDNKIVTAVGFTLGGPIADRDNYTLLQPTGLSADITARPLMVTATCIDKVYDGNTTAGVSLSDNRVVLDELSLTYTEATFADKNVGIAKIVSVTGIVLTGTDAANYSANTTVITTAAITPDPLPSQLMPKVKSMAMTILPLPPRSLLEQS